MHKGKDIIGKRLVDFATGKELRPVADIVFDAKNNRILALKIDETGILARDRLVPFNHIEAIGPNVITIESEESIIPADEMPEAKRIIDEEPRIKGHRVVSEAGETVGTITDLYFEEEDGTVTGFEVSNGVLSDAYEGTSLLPVDQITKIGEDVVFITTETAEMLRGQEGGLKRQVHDAADSAKDRVDSIRERVGQGTGYSKEFMDSTLMEARNNAKSRAEEAGPAIEQAWEKIKSKISNMKEQSAQAIEAKRIAGALGRPVTRVILDQEDNIILNTGDLITHEAVHLARYNGVLDLMLNSVYTGTPEFSKEEMKAPERPSKSDEDLDDYDGA